MRSGLITHSSLMVLLGIMFSPDVNSQTEQYKHPLFNIWFEATPHWDQELHDYNGKVFQVTHPNHNMCVNLSFVPDCRKPGKYMKRMSGLMGLICLNGPYDTILNDKKAVIMRGMGLQQKKPFRGMVVGIPGDDGLYLMEICCPEECYVNYQDRMRSILDSVRVGA
ncbi:MAG: hypothetical protein KAR19_14620 [Bacteroidales bacterium]|nr:hypothetical protein [Bacteroidales bacterium]